MGYSFVPLDSIKYLNVEITTRCSVRCPMCPRTVFPEFVDPSLDMSIDFVKKLKINSHLEKIYIIGANGEPTQHPHFLSMLREIKALSSAQIYINTHGSFKPAKWWKELASILSPTDHLVFSIDGLSDTNHLYRVNANWKQIEAAVKSSVGLVNTTWKFIVFKQNEHQIFEAMRLAKEWGVTYFSVKRSDRWNEAYWPGESGENWMSHLRPSEKFVTKRYEDVDGQYSMARKFNSVFNFKLAAVDIDAIERD